MSRSGEGVGVVLDASNEGTATRGYASEQLTAIVLAVETVAPRLGLKPEALQPEMQRGRA